MSDPKVFEILSKLNSDQQEAVKKALVCDSYMLIKGNPGTGKTQTLTALIEILVQTGKSVLFTSYTHSAVDNLLTRLKAKNVPFMRLGSSRRVAPKLLEHTESELTSGCRTIEELDKVYNKYKVVATTCFGVSNAIIWRKPFDVCIVDEATQISQPCVLRALLAAKTFILVGDPNQLPPVVKSPKAKDMGASETLFSHLERDSNTVSLRFNYRMNKKLTELANKLTYNGELKCADETVSTKTITARQNIFDGNESWTKLILSREMNDSIVIIDTGDTFDLNKKLMETDKYQTWYTKIKCGDNQKLNHYINFIETGLIVLTAKQLIVSGVDPKEIGIIAPYTAQVELHKNVFSEFDDLKQIDVNTVDQFQVSN